MIVGNRIVRSIRNRSSTSISSSSSISKIQNVTKTLPSVACFNTSSYNKIEYSNNRLIAKKSNDYNDLSHTGQTSIIRRSIRSSAVNDLEEEKSLNTITETNDNSSEKLLHQETEMEIADVVNKVDAENGDDQTKSIIQKIRPRASSSVNFKMQ